MNARCRAIFGATRLRVRIDKYRWLPALGILLAFFGLLSCNRNPPVSDHPRLASGVVLRDVTFYSDSLHRQMEYRVLMPEHAVAGKLRTVYLLHGGGGNFRDWSNYSNVADFAAEGFLLVMPEGGSSYYVNAVSPPQDRFEDYIVNDLAADVEKRFPARSDRNGKAVAGVSMGGFGAVSLGLRHPDRFAFAGGLSSAVDAPQRRFTWRRFEQSRRFEKLFGADGSNERRGRDVFRLAETADARSLPYFYLTCGRQEGLLAPNRQFARLLETRGIVSEFHEVDGGHNWNQWNGQIAGLFAAIGQRLGER